MSNAANYCVRAIVECGEPTARKDVMELLHHLKSIQLPLTLITNGSLLHTFNIDEFKNNTNTVCYSMDSVRETHIVR